MLSYAWDLDDNIDADGNGNFIDDWMTDEEVPWTDGCNLE